MDAVAVVGILSRLLEIIGFLLVARALVSWFPDLRRHQIVQLLFDITDPIMEPIRKVIPPIGAIDLSVMITVFSLFFLADRLRASV